MTSRRGFFGFVFGGLAAPFVKPLAAKAALSPIVTGAATGYTQIGTREDLSNIIYNIAPTETPFKNAMTNAQFAEWMKSPLSEIDEA